MSFNAPIKAYPFSGRKSYYRYTNRNFSIYNNDLSVDEVNKLSSVVDMLGRFRGNPSYAWIEETINDLECRFGLKANTDNVISFQKNDQLKGLEFLTDVIDATIYHQTLSIKYNSFIGPEKDFIFYPYFVKQYNNRWFIFGMTNEEERITNLALDRFIELRKSDLPFKENKIEDFTTYFDEILGVTKLKKYKEVELFVLKFSQHRFPYIVNKPIHKSQKILSEEDRTIELRLKFNKELEAQVLYYGPEVEVLEPLWFRKNIQEKLQSALKIYSNEQIDCTD